MFKLEEIEEARERMEGICINCGEHKDCCEPDARNYQCEYCLEDQVFGAEELLIMGLVK